MSPPFTFSVYAYKQMCCFIKSSTLRYATLYTSAAVSTTVMSLGVYYAEILGHLILCHQCVFPSGAAGLSRQVVWVSGATRIGGRHPGLTRPSSGWRSRASELPRPCRSSLSSRELTQRWWLSGCDLVRLVLQTGSLQVLSQQMLVDCTWGFGNNGCDGGEEWRAYEWIMKHGGITATETYGAYLGMVSSAGSIWFPYLHTKNEMHHVTNNDNSPINKEPLKPITSCTSQKYWSPYWA